MDTLIQIFVFMFGAIVGSFLNVCIYRLPKNQSIVFPASHCTTCNRGLFWHDNIPILSYMSLRGRCRFCSAKISPRYIIVEFLTATLFLLLYIVFGFSVKFFAYAAFTAGLTISTFVDFEIQEIPDQISIGGAVLGLALAIAFPVMFDTVSRFQSFSNSLLGLLAGGGSIYAMGVLGKMVFKKEAMGGGDVKLMAMIGAFLGWKLVIFTFFVAPLFGAVVGIILKLKDGREIIPYGPYLSLAAMIAILFGNKILGMFLGGLF